MLTGSRLRSFDIFFPEVQCSGFVDLVRLRLKEGKQVLILKRRFCRKVVSSIWRLQRQVEVSLLSMAALSVTVESSEFGALVFVFSYSFMC